MRNAQVSIATGLLFVVFSSGCAAWTDKPKNKDSMWSSMQFWKKPYQKPSKLAAIWTHDILTMTGKPPTRGFGGRLYFYNDKSQAISVDGELVVHGYEEAPFGQHIQTEKTKADKTFMFTAEQFTEHFSPSDLGASYSIWVPWDAADGMQKEITLIPTFKGEDGMVLQGEPAKLVLPGKKFEDPSQSTPFQHVSFQQSETPTNLGPLPQPSGLRTTTISMPAQSHRIAKESTRNSAQYNNSASSVVVGDTYNGNAPAGASHMMYSGSPQAARALTLYSALTNQANVNAMSQSAGVPSQTLPMLQAAPIPSTLPLPHMLPSQLPSAQQPPLQQYPAQQPRNIQASGLQLPNYQGQQPQNLPVPAAPNQAGQPPHNSLGPINPGLANSPFSPLPPGAVQAAFSATPQWQNQPLPQWQPFAQSQINTAGFTQVQQAAFNSTQPASNAALGLVPPQGVQPGQMTYQR